VEEVKEESETTTNVVGLSVVLLTRLAVRSRLLLIVRVSSLGPFRSDDKKKVISEELGSLDHVLIRSTGRSRQGKKNMSARLYVAAALRYGAIESSTYLMEICIGSSPSRPVSCS
jgi:hypothetical protein